MTSNNQINYTNFKALVNADLVRFRAVRGRCRLIKAIIRYPGFRYAFLLRVCRFTRWQPVLYPFFVLVLPIFLFYQRFYGLSISYATDVNGGLYIPHTGLCVVNPSAKIGRNLYLSQGVTIGKAHAGKHAGVPVIGDDVFIGPNACIFGQINIGNGAVIGANSLVIKDVAPSTTVGGVPARKISEKGSNEILGHSDDAFYARNK